jgi:predicted nucleotidyltransferase
MALRTFDLPQEKIASFCQRWSITELALFGSVLRNDFGPDSDVDVLATFAPDSRRTLLDEAKMEIELEQILGRKVDLVSRSAIEHSRNWLRRDEILSTAETIYAH